MPGLLRPRNSPRLGRWLSAEGVVWLGILSLLLGVGIFKNINLLALLASLLAAVLFICAAAVGRGLRRLEVRPTHDEQVVAGMVSLVALRVTLPEGPRLRGVRVEGRGTD